MLRAMFSWPTNVRRVGEHRAAVRVVEVTVAVDDVAHRHLEARVQLLFSQVAKAVLIGSPRMMPSGVTRKIVYQVPLRARYRSPVTGRISRAGPRAGRGAGRAVARAAARARTWSPGWQRSGGWRTVACVSWRLDSRRSPAALQATGRTGMAQAAGSSLNDGRLSSPSLGRHAVTSGSPGRERQAPVCPRMTRTGFGLMKRVFISSTYLDNIERRKQVEGCDPAHPHAARRNGALHRSRRGRRRPVAGRSAGVRRLRLHRCAPLRLD